MTSNKRFWFWAVGFSYAALLVMLARTFLDYQYVYPEMGMDALMSGGATVINLAIFGGWIYALYAAAARFSRGGMIANLLFNTLLLVFGLATVVSLCPPPCRTGWPVGQIIIWANILIGVPAVILAGRAVFSPVNTGDAKGGQTEAGA